MGNLEILTRQLWMIGTTRIFINGSFVEDKNHPNDIDGYFECGYREFATGAIEIALNELGLYQIWTWDDSRRVFDRNSAKRQLPMWHRYRVELYAHFPDLPQPCGIPDVFGNPQYFPAAFRKTRTDYKPKGIIQIVR